MTNEEWLEQCKEAKKLSPKEVAAKVNVDASTIIRYIKEGIIRGIILNPGSKRPTYLIPEFELDAILELRQ